MARGWGKSEEDLPAEKESAREERSAVSDAARRADTRLRGERHAIDLSLARIAEQLARTTNPDRRAALESAKRELEEKKKALG
ncbi:MAG TPA: hypothetical protein VKH46_10810 [Thermoanaerobaculia bacterium]|jgi:hypothetical protein|nr:hypothetical protein [Thermoanaerobaculia bacterium]